MTYKELVAGLDIGTTNIKLNVFTTTGKTVFEGIVDYPTYFPRLGWAEQSPLDWVLAIKKLFRQLTITLGTRCNQIAALGLSAHAPSTFFLSEDGDSLFDKGAIWSDQRSNNELKYLLEVSGDEFIGLGLPSASFPAKLLWYRNNMHIQNEKIAYAVGVKGFILHWLTGSVGTESSSEPGNDQKWAGVMRACGWDIKKLPSLYPTGAIIGNIRNEICVDTGLPSDIPVVIGMNDGGSSILSCGGHLPGDVVIELATNGVVYSVMQKPISSTVCLSYAYFCWKYLDDLWVAGGQTKCGAAAYRWAANAFAGNNDVEHLLLIAQDSPSGSHGVMFFPYLCGRGTPSEDPYMKASLLGLNISSSQSDIFHAVVEGVSYSIYEILIGLEKAGLSMTRIFITGGGGQNTFCRQTIADVLNQPLIWTKTKATLGAAIIASVSVGLHQDIESAIGKMVPEYFEITPKEKASSEYHELFQNYIRVRDQ